MTFIIRKDRDHGWVIIRAGGNYEQHAHVKTMGGCQQVMRLIDMGLEPKSQWLQQSVRRLLTEDEYRGLKKCKAQYVNRTNFLK